MPPTTNESNATADTNTNPDPLTADKLKSTLWYHIGKIVDEETINLGVHATPQYIGSLADLVWMQIGNVAVDLERFAKHAGRKTVRTEDVLLLGRRNEGLEGILRGEKERLEGKRGVKEGEKGDGEGRS